MIETATFGGGCFWCTEAIFKRLKGVISVQSGYTGGEADNPTYDAVSEGSTGHAEAVQIEFDPSILDYSILLEVFWETHDPTTLNRQGNDVGTQYRSAIFYHTDEQRETAEQSKEKRQKKLNDKIVTDILPFKKLYKAEEYHQSYYERNESYPYCAFVIAPKLKKLLEKFGDKVKEEYRNQVVDI